VWEAGVEAGDGLLLLRAGALVDDDSTAEKVEVNGEVAEALGAGL
jgi:hypothetical protein